jgi:hypothetical protein
MSKVPPISLPTLSIKTINETVAGDHMQGTCIELPLTKGQVQFVEITVDGQRLALVQVSALKV